MNIILYYPYENRPQEQSPQRKKTQKFEQTNYKGNPIITTILFSSIRGQTLKTPRQPRFRSELSFTGMTAAGNCSMVKA
jgi:hypothetical protein